jgi:hypothetical protein
MEEVDRAVAEDLIVVVDLVEVMVDPVEVMVDPVEVAVVVNLGRAAAAAVSQVAPSLAPTKGIFEVRIVNPPARGAEGREKAVWAKRVALDLAP